MQEEDEKRRQRALKFGVETKEMASEKRKERAARFGDGTIDAEEHKKELEEEKARKAAREARFGEDLGNLAGPKATGEKKKKNILEMSLDEYRLEGSNKKNKKGQQKGGQRDHAGEKRRRRGGFKNKTLNASGKDKKHHKRSG